MIKKLFFSLIIFSNSYCLIAQKNGDNNKIAARIMCVSLVDPLQPSLTVGAEYYIDKKHSLAIDYSLIFTTQSLLTNIGDLHNGFIIKPCYKFYRSEKQSDFFELDFFWKKFNTYKSRWIGQDLQNGVPTYYQLQDYTLVKNVYGINIKYGQKFNFLNNAIFIEPYIGIGCRAINNKVKEFPDEVINIDLPFHQQAQTNKTYFGVSFPVGIRLVVTIK